MQKNFQIIHKQWCSWPIIMNISSDQFFKKASDTIGDDIDDFDNYIVVQADEMNLKEMPAE
jgi:hypothetical protein